MLTEQEQLNYLKDMMRPYIKGRKKKYPLLQFLHGSGNELENKFWQDHSSSRMAYDLYSWMREEKYTQIKDFDFEHKLPKLDSGGTGPNIDVFIETEDEIIFVESKFTEKANLNYMNPNKKGERYLSPAYYAPTHGKKPMSLSERFHGYSYAESFATFCDEWEKLMIKEGWRGRGRVDWFEPKQETCHLCGILFYLEENKKQIKGKSIRLYNIYWEMPDDEESEMEKAFLNKAQLFVNEVIQTEQFGIKDFKIDAFSVQEMLRDNSKLSKHIQFPKGKREEIIDRNQKIVGDRKRGQLVDR